jgi:hypothetical protein
MLNKKIDKNPKPIVLVSFSHIFLAFLGEGSSKTPQKKD